MLLVTYLIISESIDTVSGNIRCYVAQWHDTTLICNQAIIKNVHRVCQQSKIWFLVHYTAFQKLFMMKCVPKN